jgi:hypothetical protein
MGTSRAAPASGVQQAAVSRIARRRFEIVKELGSDHQELLPAAHRGASDRRGARASRPVSRARRLCRQVWQRVATMEPPTERSVPSDSAGARFDSAAIGSGAGLSCASLTALRYPVLHFDQFSRQRGNERRTVLSADIKISSSWGENLPIGAVWSSGRARSSYRFVIRGGARASQSESESLFSVRSWP